MPRQKVKPFLWFDDSAEQAVAFYVSLLPDSRIDRVTHSPSESARGPKGIAFTVEFTLAGVQYIALNGGPMFKFSEAVSLQVDCEDQAEVDRLWNAIIDGGGEASHCGWCKDKWGMSWQIVPRRLRELLDDPDQDRAHRTLQAMLEMIKLDVAALEAAADGTA